jgi:glyceraldehyde 3-phosphate dehydrogenase
MTKKIAINGFGRIGRQAFKIALTKKNVEVVAINDLTDPENLAYLLRHDSVYGRYDKKVAVEKNFLVVNGKKIYVFAEPDPLKLPWKKLQVDAVLECTGFFTDKEGASKHLQAGAKTVVISAPTKSEDVITVVKGVNEEQASGQQIISNASCTTNCVAPVMKVLEDSFGIEKSLMSTIHAYTATQSIVDGPAKKDFGRGRAAALNINPTSTGAAIAATKTIPSLTGKFDGISIRVPVPCGSLTDFTCLLKKEVTVDEINKAFIKFSKSAKMKGILEVTEQPLVSQDIVGTTASAIVDLSFTRVVGGNLVKVLAWYDNEWAYSVRLVEIVDSL